MESIVVTNAEKKINDTVIFHDVSFTCESGKIYGLVGRNGAGKTMLYKCICGLSRLSSGTIQVCGKKVGVDVEIPDSLGVIIEVPGFLPNLSGYDNLKYLSGLTKKPDREQIRCVLTKVGLDPDDKKHVGKYSLGMRQRLGIAQAIMDEPQVLLLDEPMNGLDQQGVKDVKLLLNKMKSEGKTILLASHHYEDISELCDKVFSMENGRLYEAEIFEPRDRIGLERTF
jgi:ABC-2 type transport system ATP-binding protein